MYSVNSLSGGKTSSYMAVHYPADYNVFSLVTIEDKNCTPKDKKLVQLVSDKIGKEFIATAERDITLVAMLDLEQLIGKEIIWLNNVSFENVSSVKGNGWLPSALRRTCTIEMKIMAIWNWWYNETNRDKIKMGIGYRYDEKERSLTFNNKFKGIVGKHNSGKNKWEEIEWREGYFPLIENRINHWQVKTWSDKSGIIFPADSNCIGCFHKSLQQLRKNWDEEPNKMQWFSNQEKRKGKGTWRQEASYLQIKEIALQPEFNFGEGSGCQAGFCTD